MNSYEYVCMNSYENVCMNFCKGYVCMYFISEHMNFVASQFLLIFPPHIDIFRVNNFYVS